MPNIMNADLRAEDTTVRDLGGGTIGGLLRSRAASTPDQLALIFQDAQLSYAELDSQASAAGGGLLALGLQSGDSVGVFLPNCAEYLTAWFGMARAGLVQVPINTAYKGSFLDYALTHADVRALITESRLAGALATIPGLPAALTTIVFLDEVPAGFDRPGVTAITWAELLAGGDPDVAFPPVEPADTAAILLTSGTTGKSKGVVCSHMHHVVAARECADSMGSTARDRLYTCLPRFHGAAQINICLHAIYAGATIVLAPKFSASRFWDELREHQVTQFNALGSMLPVLLAQPPSPADRDHVAVRAFAAPAPPPVLYPFEDRFGVHIVEGYGLTEIKNVTYNPIHGRKVGSIGKPTASTILEIHDDHGNPVEPGQIGEIVYRPRLSGIMFTHYHRDPEATLATIKDMWWHTGDLGFTDADGFFYFVDRKKDALRRRGENISSHEVESVLRSFPGVLEAAAVATPSELGEDDVLAIIEVEPGHELDLKALYSHCDQAMPHFMVPRYYRLIDHMPRTPTGKLQKGVLRADGLTGNVWDAQAAGLTPTRNL
jgi:crotonobetaine/carnitine-CoA ligase